MKRFEIVEHLTATMAIVKAPFAEPAGRIEPFIGVGLVDGVERRIINGIVMAGINVPIKVGDQVLLLWANNDEP